MLRSNTLASMSISSLHQPEAMRHQSSILRPAGAGSIILQHPAIALQS